MNQTKRNDTKKKPDQKVPGGGGEEPKIPEPRPEQSRPDEHESVPTEVPSAPPVEVPPGRSADEGDREWAVGTSSAFDAIYTY